MRKAFFALLLSAISAAAFAQERPTAYEALRVVGNRLNRDYVNHVISVTGVRGSPQPETWQILVEDQHARGGVREIEVSHGRIVSERTPVRTVVGSTEGARIKTARLNLDSSGAFAVASHTAEKSNALFSTASYTLRTDERGDPVWIVTLQDERNRPVGTIHINCARGNVVRTEGMFSGATMRDVETERDLERPREGDREGEGERDDEEHGILYGPRRRLRDAFERTREDATNMFDRVRRNFTDFINRG
jgi:hypothetical protein